MKWSTRGACAVLSGALLFTCALAEVAVGLRCMTQGAAVMTHFRLSRTAGAFYSGALVSGGQLLLALALLCCSTRAHRCRNLALVAVVVLLLGILTAFSGAVLDGDAAALVKRKYTHFCLSTQESRVCTHLREYQRSLVLSTALSALECVLGLLHLLAIKRYKAAQFNRRQLERQQTHEALFSEERDAPLPHVSYINLAVSVLDEPHGAESHYSAYPSLELPGYAPVNTAPPSHRDQPPAYDDIYPSHRCGPHQQEALCVVRAASAARGARDARHRDTL
ncbi:unnamed protein product [Knipowitschia caucasica]|uniref:Transmembrane protein 271 n=1 Tax=Knipowitschia caucasica TaxID=637954 RepID=A0AAV2MI99_KNICA